MQAATSLPGLVQLTRPRVERIHPAFLAPAPFSMATAGLLSLGFPRIFPQDYPQNSPVTSKSTASSSFTIDAILGGQREYGTSEPAMKARQNFNRQYHNVHLSYSDGIRTTTMESGNVEPPPSYTDDAGVTSADWQRCKGKRVRTIFTPEQLEKLEKEFERQQYMVGTERYYLAGSLKLSEAQVKVWFQNRRIKWRKQHLEAQQARLAKLDLLLAGQQQQQQQQQPNSGHHVTKTRNTHRHVTCHNGALAPGGNDNADDIDMKISAGDRLDHVAASRDSHHIADESIDMSFVNRHQMS